MMTRSLGLKTGGRAWRDWGGSVTVAGQQASSLGLTLWVLVNHWMETYASYTQRLIPVLEFLTLTRQSTYRLRLDDSDFNALIALWVLSGVDRWRLTALDNFVPYRRTDISNSRAPVRAKNVTYIHYVTYFLAPIGAQGVTMSVRLSVRRKFVKRTQSSSFWLKSSCCQLVSGQSVSHHTIGA